MSPSPSPPDGRGAALVIGHGSAGQRHERVLTELGFDVAIVSRRSDVGGFTSIREALAAKAPDYVVVATETMDHARALDELTHLPGNPRILVEKPLFGASEDAPGTEIPELCVGYPLRMHSGLRKLREEIAGQTVISAQIYCGQYLPDWRPNRDYRESYSAKKSAAGGVLRDLSHELDYLMWILGGWKRLTANGGKLGDLEIDSEDIVTLLVEFERCPAAVVQLNYLDSELRREVIAVTNRGTVKADLVANSIEYKGEIDQYETSRNQTYLDQHRAILSNAHRDNCTFEQGLEVVSMIDAIERSMDENRWITNE